MKLWTIVCEYNHNIFEVLTFALRSWQNFREELTNNYQKQSQNISLKFWWIHFPVSVPCWPDSKCRAPAPGSGSGLWSSEPELGPDSDSVSRALDSLRENQKPEIRDLTSGENQENVESNETLWGIDNNTVSPAVLQTSVSRIRANVPLLVICSECNTFHAVEERLDNGLESCKTQMLSIKVHSLNDKIQCYPNLVPS